MKRILLSVIFATVSIMLWAQTGVWSGNLDVQGTKIQLVFHLDGENPTMDSPDQGARNIPIQVKRTDQGSINIQIPSIKSSYEGLCLEKKIVGTFKQWGASLPLTLTQGEQKLNRPQSPVGPFPYMQEEVTFSNGDAVLKGTLLLPNGCTRKTPVVIMITGSGLQNRDEEIFEHKPFAVIADALARAGVASLRYDDRGFGESTGDIINCTTEDLKNDALAGIRLLREKFDKVGVIGHSEGGSIALMLASEKQADFVVSLAGAVVSGAETLIWQNRVALASSGLPSTTIDSYCMLISEAFEARVSGEKLPSAEDRNIPDDLKKNYQAVTMQLQSPYMKYFLAMDMRPLLGSITCPVLALNGSKDQQVNPESNLSALKADLTKNRLTCIEQVEGLNHLFQHCTTGDPIEYKEIEETFSPDILNRITEWIIGLNK